ncbi:MAG: hypothetical protein EXQ96_05030 [Alphaproteobacteria bacterium]|nr:hypothetical protein [Alphaproteobacteria bacterium]
MHRGQWRRHLRPGPVDRRRRRARAALLSHPRPTIRDVRIHNQFEVPAAAADAFAILTDVPRIAPCLPGAELTEVVGEGVYKGRISVRLGPVALAFSGTVRFEELDASGLRARVKAQGADVKGRGGASAETTFRVEQAGTTSRVSVETDLTLSGAVAQYGRGTAMVSELANQIVGQFAACLRERIAAQHPAAPAAVAPLSVAPLLWRSLWTLFKGALARLLGRQP